MPQGDIPAEAKGWPHGVADGPRAVGQKVVEEPPIHQIGLHAKADVAGRIPIDAAAETVEAGPIDLTSSRHELCNDRSGDRVCRVRCYLLTDRAQGGPDKQRNWLEAPIGELRSQGKGLRKSIRGNDKLIAGRNDALFDELLYLQAELLLQGSLEQIGRQRVVSSHHRIIEAGGKPGPQIHTCLEMETTLRKVQFRGFKTGEPGVNVESLHICLLCKSLNRKKKDEGRGEKHDGEIPAWGRHGGLLEEMR